LLARGLVADLAALGVDTDQIGPGRQQRLLLLARRSILKALLANARISTIRDQLKVAIGETDALTGWLLFDLGRGNEAADA
jgi:hypothetical protein